MSTKAGIEILECDPTTSIIILLGKSADFNVSKEILSICEGLSKPVIALFIGSEEIPSVQKNIITVSSIEQAAFMANELIRVGGEGDKEKLNRTLKVVVKHPDQVFGFTEEINALTLKEVSNLGVEQKYCRGLFCGGTLAYEASNILNGSIDIKTNFPFRDAPRASNPMALKGNAIIDLGADEFTVGRAHPMIDPFMRNKMLERQINDDEVALIFFDVILGFGSHPDPCKDLVRVIKSGDNKKVFLAHICGTESDPQILSSQQEMLEDSGVLVLDSNAKMARMVKMIMSEINHGGY
jgi:hypothetical protein